MNYDYLGETRGIIIPLPDPNIRTEIEPTCKVQEFDIPKAMFDIKPQKMEPAGYLSPAGKPITITQSVVKLRLEERGEWYRRYDKTTGKLLSEEHHDLTACWIGSLETPLTGETVVMSNSSDYFLTSGHDWPVPPDVVFMVTGYQSGFGVKNSRVTIQFQQVS